MKLSILVAALFLLSAYPVLAKDRVHDPDLNRDGGISIVEAILSQRELFHEMDANADKSLTLDELETFLDKAQSQKTSWDYKNQFEHIDTTDDKALSELEFLEGVENEFRMKDRNRDNMITTDEMPM